MESTSSGLGRGSSLSDGESLVNEKAAWALQVSKSLHDFDSIVTEKLLSHVPERYNIPANYKLLAPWLGQRAYDPFLNGFGLTLDTLELGLRFSLHPVIEACLSWW